MLAVVVNRIAEKGSPHKMLGLYLSGCVNVFALAFH